MKTARWAGQQHCQTAERRGALQRCAPHNTSPRGHRMPCCAAESQWIPAEERLPGLVLGELSGRRYLGMRQVGAVFGGAPPARALCLHAALALWARNRRPGCLSCTHARLPPPMHACRWSGCCRWAQLSLLWESWLQ